jgi:hypothetical protein
MMDSARQVVRWSIPGLVLVFTLCTLQGIENIWIFGSVGEAFQHSAFLQLGSGAAAVIVVAGVPLGFLLNQFYYALHWNWMPLRIAARDRGGEALCAMSLSEIEMIQRYHKVDLKTKEMWEVSTKTTVRSLIPTLIFGREFPRLKNEYNRTEYRDAKKRNFEAVRFYLTLVSTRTGLSQFKNEYTSLSDIYHGIGASLTAVVAATAIFLLYHLSSSRRALFVPSALWWPLVFNGALVFAIVRALQATRKITLMASQAILQSAICWYADARPKDFSVKS